MIHAGLHSPFYENFRVTAGLVRGTYFDGTFQKYSRPMGFSLANSTAITSFIVEKCTFHKYSVQSQVNWNNLTIRDCVFREGQNGWVGNGNSADSSAANVRDKYHPTYNWWFRWRNAGAISLGYLGGTAATNTLIDNNVFYGQKDEPINHDDSGTNSGFVVSNNQFIKVGALAGPYGDSIYRSYNGGTITFTNNKHSGYGTVPSGVTAMTGGELTTQTARAIAQNLTVVPSVITANVGGTGTGTVNVTDSYSASVTGWTGIASSANTSIATTSLAGTTLTVTGVAIGNTTLTVAGAVGAATTTATANINTNSTSGRAPIFRNRRRK